MHVRAWSMRHPSLSVGRLSLQLFPSTYVASTYVSGSGERAKDRPKSQLPLAGSLCSLLGSCVLFGHSIRLDPHAASLDLSPRLHPYLGTVALHNSNALTSPGWNCYQAVRFIFGRIFHPRESGESVRAAFGGGLLSFFVVPLPKNK